MKMIENDLTQGIVNRFGVHVSAYLVRIPACLIAANIFHSGLLAVGFALPMASLMQVIVGFAFFFSGRWKKKLL